jgi:HJR/Mrr/RecB family endonuclease
MARKLKAEDSALLYIAIIGIIAAIAYGIVKAIVTLVIAHWIAVIGIVLGITLLILILLYIDDYFNLRQNNKKILKLNSIAEISRSNILIDYENFTQNKEIITIFDNAVIHFPQKTFLDPEYLYYFEERYLRNKDEYPQLNRIKIELESYKYYLNKVRKDYFKQKELNVETVPKDFLIRVSDNRPHSYLLDYENAGEFPSDFSMFEDLVFTKYKFLSWTSRKYCIWKLLKERGAKYYSELWDNQYSNVFETAESSNLKDLVYSYSNILFINHLDNFNISKFTYYLMEHDINPGNRKFYEYHNGIATLIESEFNKRKQNSFEKKFTSQNLAVSESSKKYTINDTDFMNGYQFEHFVALIFTHFGYKTTVTPSSGDQGIDVIAEKDGERVGIQAKCYSNAVSNSAIQEATAGIAHHKCNKGIVITNNNFTKSAFALAESNQIILWNRQKLAEIINEVF